MTQAAAAEPDLIARREGSAGIIRLNRPKAINAVTLEMFRDIDRALDQFEVDPAVAIILLEGAGERGLCAGGDSRNPMSPSWTASSWAAASGCRRTAAIASSPIAPSSRCLKSAWASSRMSAAPGFCRIHQARSEPISA